MFFTSVLLAGVLVAVVADPFPMPMAEERRGGLLYLAHPDVNAVTKHHADHALAFESIGVESDVLEHAFRRYKDILTTPSLHMAYEWDVSAPEALLDESNRVDRVLVYVQSSDQTLDVYTEETYSIRISSPDVTIEAQTVYGALRALETLAQSTHVLEVHASTNVLVLNETALYDSPRFRHRGLLLDTARHFLPISVIKTHLDAMVMSKMNVFHWHMTDDESWPFVSKSVPELSAAGAFSAGRTYDDRSIEEVVAYAKYRGIRVVVEFDSPGHTASIGKSHPDLMVTCAGDHRAYSSINPANNATYDLLWRVFRDAGRVFPDRAWHLGGNEIDMSCWSASEAVMKTFEAAGQAVVSHVRRLMEFGASMGKVGIVYNDLWEIPAVKKSGVLPAQTVVQVWKPSGGSRWKETVDAVTKSGYRVLVSAPWTVDPALSPQDWKTFWQIEPLSFNRRASLEQTDRVLGGEVAVWSELVDATNSVSKTWPLAAAVGERLWSQESVNDVVDAEQRLFRVRCRMVARGIAASPVRKGECPFIDARGKMERGERWILT